MANSNASEPAGAGWRATVLSVLLVAAVVAIPLFLLRSLVHERIELKGRAQANANESWGGPQTIDGPALEIPLTAAGISAGRIVLLPQSLDASAELSEIDHRPSNPANSPGTILRPGSWATPI